MSISVFPRHLSHAHASWPLLKSWSQPHRVRLICLFSKLIICKELCLFKFSIIDPCLVWSLLIRKIYATKRSSASIINYFSELLPRFGSACVSLTCLFNTSGTPTCDITTSIDNLNLRVKSSELYFTFSFCAQFI